MHEPNESGLPIDQGEARKPVVWIMGQDALDAEAARRALSARHEVELLADGEAALSRLPHEAGPDALILDGALPGRPCIELCRRLRATRNELDLPILMLTAPMHPVAILEGLSAGANDCLAKPYDAAELLGRVSALVRMKQLHEAHGREQAAALSQDLRQNQERDRLLAAEQAARKEAEAAYHLMDQFLATVSHELRTPLNVILGWVRILRSGKLPGDRHDHALETVERNARAQAQLIEDLLDVSRIMTGKLRLDVQPIEPLEIIEAALSSVQPSASAKGIRLLRVLDPSAGPVVGDPGRLQQIVWNLLSNAIKFTPKGGRVQIRLERVESSVEIVVTDTGQGIDPAFLPHIFERFRQADGSTTRTHGGLGLGLAIVKDLVELHGGTIEALSGGKGRGATLSVRLPIAVLRSSHPEQRRSHPTLESAVPIDCPPEISGLHIAIVDDEVDARELLSTVLQGCGAKVTMATTAAEALKVIEQLRPDVLLSDIGMPGEDGYTLIRKIRALPQSAGGRTPVVALTAYARTEDRTRALRAGFTMHLPKPVEPAELLAVVANIAGRRIER